MIVLATHDSDRLTIERTHHGPPLRTRGVCEGASAFGLTLDDLAPAPPHPSRIHLDLPLGALVLIVGPSGSGKSTLLGDVACAAEERGWCVVRPPAYTRGPRACVDRFKSKDVNDRLRALASAGLAEAGAALRPPGALSAGERERLRLGLALAKAELYAKTRERVLLVIDEFAASLDRATALSMSVALARFVSRNRRVRVLCATNRAEVQPELRPSTSCMLDGAGTLRIDQSLRSTKKRDRFEIVPATRADLEALSKFHYRPGPPATVARVIAIREIGTRSLAGVLATSMPTLNASWRTTAWDGLFDDTDKRAAAQKINASLRTIARVIVAPEHRACGLAVRLVRAYLANPDTTHTEAIAAMGRACPFFDRAGMTAHEPPIPARDARLLDALDHAGLSDRWRLATPDTALRRAIDGAGIDFVDRELRRWATDSRATASRATEPIEQLFERACRTLAATPLVYTHTATR